MNASGSFVPERTAIRIRAGRSLFLALFLAIVPIRIAAADWQGIAPPSGRHGGAAIYDSQRNRLVV
jgi:hypothetical protein